LAAEESPPHAQKGLSEERGLEEGGDYCSNIKTAGFVSLNEITTNFDEETPYMIPFPPMFPAMVPLPFVGDEDMEYVALTVVPRLAPLGAPTSSIPEILPVGLAPSAVNSPERIATLTVAGVVVEPAYVPLTELLVNDPAVCGSPNPNETALSGTMIKAWLELTI